MSKVQCEFCHQYLDSHEYANHRRQHEQLRPDGQQNEYATLPPEQRHAGGLDDAPRVYMHRKCGARTGMPQEIIRTYLHNPWFYLSRQTFCAGCRKHVPQDECVWIETSEDLQSYTERL
jgi:hypothetical protein